MKRILILLSLFLLTECKIITKSNNNPYEKYSYYNKNNLTRYINYKNNHKYLSYNEIITKVNIGLDKPFYTNTKISNNLNSNLILINKYIKIPNNYIPNNLEEITTNSKTKLFLTKDAKEHYIKMSNDIKKNNLNIRLISAYRSFNYQLNLYSNYLKKDPKHIVDTYSARPGHSEHHTALAIDIDNINTSFDYFEYTDEYEWMIKNSYKYGYILRYPKYKEEITGYKFESWHYRYVGIKDAKIIHKNSLTLEEYLVKYKKQTNY